MRRHRRFAAAQRSVSVLVLVVAGLLAWVTPAHAEHFPIRPVGWGHPGHHAPGWPQSPVGLQVTTNVAEDCHGVLLVAFDLWTPDPARPDGKAYRPDDGRGVLQVYEVSGRSHGGAWVDAAGLSDTDGDIGPYDVAPPTSAGENRIRWAGWRMAKQYGTHAYTARVRHNGATAHEARITEGCG